MNGNGFSAGGLPVTLVPNPNAADGQPADDQWKTPVRVHTTGPVTLSGLQTVDGVTLTDGDRVLVKDQIIPQENGIYSVSSATWKRALDCYLWSQFPAAVVGVEAGLSVGDTLFICNCDWDGVVGTTANYWVSVSETAGTLPSFTPLRAVVSDVLGVPVASPTTSEEIGFVSGVTSPIQTQFAFLENKAGSAFTIAVNGTNAAATAQATANAAQSAAASAQSTGDSAYALAQTGTNLAIALGDKYVRTTRFYSIGAGTTGAATLPANSIVVLDDFGGATDAVIATIDSGRPTFNHAYTTSGAVVTTSFDSSGNYSLSGAPNGYPVALVYRVRQKLSQFDSTSSDIIGDYDIESALSYEVHTITAGTTQVPADSVWRAYMADTSAGNVTFILPDTTGLFGTTIHVKKITTDSNVVLISSITGTQPIDLLAQQTISDPMVALKLIPSGTNWFII